MKKILQIHNLHKVYGKVNAVNDLSFTIEKGNVYGLLGPNGSGKSTTLGIVLNVVNATSGRFTWFDGNVDTHHALKRVGAIIERPNFYPFMTAVQNLELVCKIKGISTDKIDEKLHIVDLYDRKDSKFKTFSLGMKQRLAIASALLNDPDILILDEPTNGLDPQGIQDIRSIITSIAAQGTTILLASHLLDEVEKVCSHVVILRNGKKIYEGRTDALSTSFGIIELRADHQTPETLQLLQKMDGIKTLKQEGNTIYCSLSKELATSDINRYLFENGISLSHLTKRKPSLEQQFLEITQQEASH